MSLAIQNLTGDGALADYISAQITLPDSGQSVTVTGAVQKVGFPRVKIIGSPVTAPTVPTGGGFLSAPLAVESQMGAPPAQNPAVWGTGWIIQVNWLTGMVSVKTQQGAIPSPDPNNLQIYSDKVNIGDNAALSLGLNDTFTPDNW